MTLSTQLQWSFCEVSSVYSFVETKSSGTIYFKNRHVFTVLLLGSYNENKPHRVICQINEESYTETAGEILLNKWVPQSNLLSGHGICWNILKSPFEVSWVTRLITMAFMTQSAQNAMEYLATNVHFVCRIRHWRLKSLFIVDTSWKQGLTKEENSLCHMGCSDWLNI